MNIFVEGELPVAIKVLDGQTELKLKKFKLRALTIQESLKAQVAITDQQYSGIAELCASIELIDAEGLTHDLAYDSLVESSAQNLRYIETKKAELDAKERAEI